ncbi:cytochrome c-type biogenesis CcmH-like mitochondrial protein isoform X1 [Juglans microcarpa x Juglans regia]|uniref:cytochrome c-type biogenesis CcmH-like mitochondrial protein isoform X1 n=2 Tax=Juglans microcarpa x Juglans regia TaxID=2249226 RepID=UPI001B7F5B3A|nr:cytochrome c-type biogenesis CcmH-like mitochondrial protein isoform X1 [Juglans microcarpa x Juglans regia]XP_041019292.1 cytochrome c-type biogenesis CcmH-like mitochondrial protein isoform X1 [Juglans microcarpa x Juglans regia]
MIYSLGIGWFSTSHGLLTGGGFLFPRCAELKHSIDEPLRLRSWGETYLTMENEEDAVKNTRLVEARARNISHNVRCTECGSQSIEDSQADIAILLRKLIRDEIRAGKSDKDIFKKLENDYGETVLYAPKFDMQTAALWLSPILVAGAAAGVWAYKKHKQNTNVHIMALNLVRGVALTPKEKETMLDLLTPPPSNGTTPSWWRGWPGQ